MSASRVKTKQRTTTPPDKNNIKLFNPSKTSPRPLPGLSFEEPTSSEMAKLLKELNEREKDLELAANLGNSLLQENKELLEKNEFLEESLATSNETISQLQRHLKQRSKLFRTIVDLENEYNEEEEAEKACCSNSCPRSVDFSRMEKQLSNLEKDNTQLRTKVDDLEEQKLVIEKKEKNTVNDYISQLRAANLKIAQIQVQFGEKAKQCESQTEEIQRLLSDISERKRRERILWDENEDIQTRLDDAIHTHEQLRSEIELLQERHLDLIVMLRDTEDELREHRQRAEAPPPPPIRRTNSVDSLYDSLASELEGADSGGCYGTPMFSARYGPSTHCSSLGSGGAIDQSLSQPSTSNALVDCQTQQEISVDHQNFDVPSRALLEAVRSTLEDRKHFQKLNINSKQKRKISKEEGKESKQQQIDSPSTPIVDCISLNNKQQRKVFQDACCSPIQFSPRQSNECASSTFCWKFSTPQNTKNNISPQITSGSSTESIDSLSSYCPPKLGTPGRPGSKDLDFSIRRLSVRKEMNESYARYRNSKGLPPTQNCFYSPNGMNHHFVYQSVFPSYCPTKQLNRLCINSSNNNSPIISKSSPECSRFSYRPIIKKEEENNLFKNSLGGIKTKNNGGIFCLADLFVKNNGRENNKIIVTSGSCSSGLEFYGNNSKNEDNLSIKNSEESLKSSISSKNIQKRLFAQQKINEFGIGNLLQLNSSNSNTSVVTAIEIQQNTLGVLKRYGGN
uniref:HAP1 N-terminal domain-containing protein n=1 Tax=Meloidogyne hapla TaxID=6305 RepID=A0A1I8C0I4_MELHA